MSTCPNGHQSNTDDWCEICGHRIPPAGPVTSAPSPTPYAQGYGQRGYAQPRSYDPGPGPAAHTGEQCPMCGTPREGLSQFCEECRYNFVTHVGTQFVQPPQSVLPAPPLPQNYPPPYERYDIERSRPSQMNRPAEPLSPDAVTTASGDFTLPPPEHHGPRAGGGVRTGSWTAVVTADRDYFTVMMARSGPEGQGLFFPQYHPERRVPLVGGQVSIGRRRVSTGESPDIDLAYAPEDPGVSHKHALLVQQPDGCWAVVDQDSTNGTTINGEEEPISPYVPFRLREGDSIHLGAWTTITLVRE